ncbi:MAG: T9SS type A sorting domain-containing protein [Bacteroidales bacterium]|nr:T9SS type A sorting domain-containing protein [Bacteroidales bacterium]
MKTDLQNARIEVYDMIGRTIVNQEIVSDITTINTDNKTAGMYFWKVIANGKVAESGRWVKN